MWSSGGRTWRGVRQALLVAAVVATGCGEEIAGPRPGVPGAPQQVDVVPGEADVRVTWAPPATDGGHPLTGYRVTCAPACGSQVVDAQTLEAIFTQLAEDVDYAFSVQALNAQGGGATATTPTTKVAKRAKVPGAPAGVGATAGDASARVTWTAPTNTGSSALVRSIVRCSPACTPQSVEAPATALTVTGLTNGTAYTFTVASVNATGEGPQSAPSSAVTPRAPATATVPGAPTGVTASAGDARATVSWVAPASTGGSALVRYVVRCTPACPPVSVNTPATSTAVSGLANGTAYTFTVAAVNGVGEGPRSAPSAAVTPQAAPTGAPARWVSAYYVGYQRGLYPEAEVDFSTLTHLIVGRITPTPSGGVTTHFDIDTTTGPAMARTLSTRAHAAGKKAVLMLGGAGEHANFVSAASAANRATFINTLVSTMDALGYDGLDVDWEPIEAADRAPLLALLQGLRAARPNMVLTLPVGWVNANAPEEVDGYYAQVAAVVDQVNLMSYDMAGPWTGWEVWHSSALDGEAGARPSSIEASVRAYLAAGVPAAKLGMGIGFYGTCWRGVTQPRVPVASGVQLVASDNVMSYANIVTQYAPQAPRTWDAAAQVPYLSAPGGAGPQACNFVSYEDAQSILAKGAFARANGLGGTIIWTLNQGHLAGQPVGSRDPLMRAAFDGFLAP